MFFEYQIVSEYLRMPPMARLDDFDKCFLDIAPDAKATYCMITSLLKPNESSDIWRIVNVCTPYLIQKILIDITNTISVCVSIPI